MIETLVRGPQGANPGLAVGEAKVFRAAVLDEPDGKTPCEVPVNFQFLLTEDPDHSRRLRIERLV